MNNVNLKVNGKVDSLKTDMLVKKALIEEGYSKELELKSYILDNERITYQILNPIVIDGKETKILREISCVDYMGYLRRYLEENGNQVYDIYPIIRDDKISYYLNYQTKSIDNGKVR